MLGPRVKFCWGLEDFRKRSAERIWFVFWMSSNLYLLWSLVWMLELSFGLPGVFFLF